MPESMQEQSDEWITPQELARRTGRSLHTVYKWIEKAKAGRGYLPFRRIPFSRCLEINWTLFSRNYVYGGDGAAPPEARVVQFPAGRRSA